MSGNTTKGNDPTTTDKKMTKKDTMFASVCTKYGHATEVFEVRHDIPKPSITKPNQVLVRNEFTTVNPADCKQRSGNLKLVAKHEFPLILGQDFCGKVVSIGSNVTKIKVGDTVMGSTAPRNSCAAEYLVCFEHECISVKLDNTGFIDDDNGDESKYINENNTLTATMTKNSAAACPTAYCTAWKGLFDIGRLPIKDKKHSRKKTNYQAKSILVIGASGSVGSAAVQLAVGVAAKLEKVVVICGTNNIEYVQSLGTKETSVIAVDYRQLDYESKLLQQQPFDLILDCVGGDDYYYKLHPLLNLNNPKAMYVTCVGPVLHGGSEPITYHTLLSTICTLLTRIIGNYCLFGRYNSRYQIYLGFDTVPLPQIKRVLENGTIVPRMDPKSPLPLEELGTAHEMVESGHSNGKVLVRVVQTTTTTQ